MLQKAVELGRDEPFTAINWPSEIRRLLDKLTHKQRHFALLRASGVGVMECYETAYDTLPETRWRTKEGAGYLISQNPKISSVVDIIRQWIDTEWLMDASETIEYGLARLYEEAEFGEKSADRIRAASALLKAHGAFVSRSEVKHIHTVDSPVSDLIEGLTTMLGLAVPITPKQIEQASVETVEFIDTEKEPHKL